MLRVVLNGNAVLKPEQGTIPDAETPTAGLIDDDGTMVAYGHLVADAPVLADGEAVTSTALRFVSVPS